jgi:hypothetical protein
MTLKEKFLELAFAKISIEELRDESVKIADEFAIDFAEWLIKRETKYFESLKELLEIYKKGL